jgi:hypothetical protein
MMCPRLACVAYGNPTTSKDGVPRSSGQAFPDERISSLQAILDCKGPASYWRFNGRVFSHLTDAAPADSLPADDGMMIVTSQVYSFHAIATRP